MVLAQQEANRLFLKSDTKSKDHTFRTLSALDCGVSPNGCRKKVLSFNAHLSDGVIKVGWLSKALHGD